MPLKKTTKTRPHLSWLFVAFFADGSTIKQTQADKSRIEKGKSAYFDVEQRALHTKLLVFELWHEDTRQKATVDLVTGTFILNGTPFHGHNQAFNPERYPLELVFFRETKVERDQKSTVQEDMSIKKEWVGPVRHFVSRTFVGWKTEVNKETKQVTIALG